MNTQAERVTSSAVVQSVADKLEGRNLSFFEAEPTDFISKLKRKLKGTRTRPEPATKLKQAIIDDVIVVAADRRSELIKITMRSTNPQEARQIVDAFIRAYYDIEVLISKDDENKQLRLLEVERKVLVKKIESDRQMIYQLGQEYGDVTLQGRQDVMLQRIAPLRH
jgi:uncharacterized protein involved in exopolysaccharide biosynthesis